MIRMECDKCGVAGRITKRGEGPRVVSVVIQPGGRRIELCGDCRSRFAFLITCWLDPDAPEIERLRLRYGSFLNWCIGYCDFAPGEWGRVLRDRLRNERAALAAAQEPLAFMHDYQPYAQEQHADSDGGK